MPRHRRIVFEALRRRDVELVRYARPRHDLAGAVDRDRLHRRRPDIDAYREIRHAAEPYASDAITASCTSPFVVTKLCPSTSARPSSVLQRPPASSSTGMIA